MAKHYDGQAEVDRAFDDYVKLQLADRQTRRPIACVGCGSSNYCFGTSAGGDAGSIICTDCGIVDPNRVVFETMYGRSLPTRCSNYKRIHHWHERISQLLLLESTIPPHHLLAIGEKLLDGSYQVINKDTIRCALRSLGLQVYIEKWLQIIERLTGIMPPCPGGILLQRLDTLFLELQRPFNAKKHSNRRNFLNYNYVFCRRTNPF